MNYREGFNTVKQAKAFCQEHFNGLDLQAVCHPQEHHCATATWGGRTKGMHVCIIKTVPELFQAQSQMHAQLGQEVLLNQTELANASPTLACQQGSDTQMETTKKGADITGLGNRTWSSDVLLESCDLPYDGMPTTMFMSRIPSGASGY
jgi:hypothetical protein